MVYKRKIWSQSTNKALLCPMSNRRQQIEEQEATEDQERKLQNFKEDIFWGYCCGKIYSEGIEIGGNERKLLFLESSQE